MLENLEPAKKSSMEMNTIVIMYANDFTEIPHAFAVNHAVRARALGLVAMQPIPGKVTEGGNRVDILRDILESLVRGNLTLKGAIDRVKSELPRHGSVHGDSNRVFPEGWAERLIRTQYSRFYTHALLVELSLAGETECFVPHSKSEDNDSPCSRYLAGKTHSIATLMTRLTDAYSLGRWSEELKIPNHPHCTHVVHPLQSSILLQMQADVTKVVAS